MPRPPLTMRLLHGLATLYLLTCVALQFNDPDALLWIVGYAALCAAAAGAALRKAWAPRLAGVMGLVGTLWAAGIAAGGLDPISLDVLFGDLRMKTLETERWRELLGLLLATGWMGVILVEAWLRGRKAAES